ncbi:hypothetical protein BH24PSE2_BH24PSE2_18010 [soil metagenome]
MRLRTNAASKTFFLMSLPVWTLLAILGLLDSLWYYWSRDAEIPLLNVTSYWTGYYLAWALVAPLLCLIIVRGRLSRRPAPVLVGAYLLLCFGVLLVVEVASVTATALIWWPFAEVSPVGFIREITQTLALRSEQPLITRYDHSFFVFFGTVAVVHFFDYYAGAEAERKEWLRSRLKALRLELNPHFLFNSLHGVTMLIDQQPAVAEQMLVRLGDYLRRVLRESNADKLTLERELSFVREYVQIEQLRFGGRLQLDVRIDASLGHAMVPTMLLQPLIENALLHGGSLNGQSDPRIEVSADRRGDRLLLGVRNMTAATPTARRGLGGIGHENLRARLHALYGDDFDMRGGRRFGTRYVVEIDIPYEAQS